MDKFYTLPFLIIFLYSCKPVEKKVDATIPDLDFTIAFGSCNKHTLKNDLWDDVLNTNPDVWVWGGDIVYADTDKAKEIKAMYAAQNNVEGYKTLKTEIPVIGTWDDHDYGLNDGGVEFKAKKESQQVFLDFMDIDKNDARRSREGIYTSHDYDMPNGRIKILVLDTRYFRTALTPDTETKKRHRPNAYGEGTILGTEQWQWLTAQLTESKADFNIIVSSIQFLSNEHGFECWGNFPHEVSRLKEILVTSKAKGTIILSGDRHISEFSRTKIDGLAYPLIDFTSSGLTHVYSDFNGEPNPYRVGQVVFDKSFGSLKINLKSKRVSFKMIGDNGKLLGKLEQGY
ncbi:MAG: alkaline phosphatase D family protein [Bacteroidota bacterium]